MSVRTSGSSWLSAVAQARTEAASRSLEARVPLLDHKLLEFAARVPASLKLRGGTSKYLLRRALERRVPRALFTGPKHGFTAPIARWLRGPLKPMARELLFDGRLADRGFHLLECLDRNIHPQILSTMATLAHIPCRSPWFAGKSRATQHGR